MEEEINATAGDDLEEAEFRLETEMPKEKSEALDNDEWRKMFEKLLGKGKTFTDVGGCLLEGILKLSTPLGVFARNFCHPSQPLPSAELTHDRRGDLLPIHPASVKVGSLGITQETLKWVQAVLICLNFNYCCGWSKPVCVPIKRDLSSNQRLAIQQLAKAVKRNIISTVKVPNLSELRKLLLSKRFDYSGNPVEHMQELEAKKVIAAWPDPGCAAVKDITELLDNELLTKIGKPSDWCVPLDKRPTKRTRSKVRASDDTWFLICQAAHKRGMMRPVKEEDLFKDVDGHFVVNGAGGVSKRKVVGGVEVELQRFISILVPTNEHSIQLPGDQDTLPYVGQLTGIVLEEDNDLYIHSEDFTSAFNLFRVPESWSAHFAFAKKVRASAFGGSPNVMVRPAMAVIPMGWHSAVTLVQAAVRHLVFNLAGVPRLFSSVEKGKALPESDAGDSLTVVYLDNYDELRVMKRLFPGEGEEAASQSEGQKKFNEVCDRLKLQRNLGKQLVMAFSGAIQGGELDGRSGVIRVAQDKLMNFIGISMALLLSPVWKELPLRHWTGKAAFVAAFKRPLFSVLQEIFEAIQASLRGDVSPSKDVIDEVMIMCTLSVVAETCLRATISPVISCTDASPTGGGSGVATQFKDRCLDVADPVEQGLTCGECATPWAEREEERRYPCPRACGMAFCRLSCLKLHEKKCERNGFYAPRFGERFSGGNCPLTKAVALAGIAVQTPMDKEYAEAPWEFFTDDGKSALEEAENEADLAAAHWAPNCRTFSRARGRPMRVKGKGKGKVEGPRAVRSDESPWGLQKLSKDDAVKVRQDNKMAARSLKGLKEGARAGRVVSLEHPWGSILWETKEAKEILNDKAFWVSEYSHCCFGGDRTKWTRLVHNCKALHEALHRPSCPGHPNLKKYEVHWEEGSGYRFDTSEEAEYPWGFCVTYANALRGSLLRTIPGPVGNSQATSASIIYSQVRGATRGFQDEKFVREICQGVYQILHTMKRGKEHDHLKFLMRQVGLRGTDVRLCVPSEEVEKRETLVPYPAFRWLWKAVLSYKWSEPQHINILEATAVLTEFRRRLRQPDMVGKRFFNVVDSMVIYFAMSKGRSGSRRLNRTLRRIMALSICSQTIPVNLWTISKWNFADAPSRRFEGSSGTRNDA